MKGSAITGPVGQSISFVLFLLFLAKGSHVVRSQPRSAQTCGPVSSVLQDLRLGIHGSSLLTKYPYTGLQRWHRRLSVSMTCLTFLQPRVTPCLPHFATLCDCTDFLPLPVLCCSFDALFVCLSTNRNMHHETPYSPRRKNPLLASLLATRDFEQREHGPF